MTPDGRAGPGTAGAVPWFGHWALLAGAILLLDYFTGPYIQVAILFVFPVALATWRHGWVVGSLLAAALPLVRLPFFLLAWHVPSSWALEAADTAIDVFTLLALVAVIDYLARQRREIQVSRDCSILQLCKRIRDESGGWLQLERYITDRSEAQFSTPSAPTAGAATTVSW